MFESVSDFNLSNDFELSLTSLNHCCDRDEGRTALTHE